MTLGFLFVAAGCACYFGGLLCLLLIPAQRNVLRWIGLGVAVLGGALLMQPMVADLTEVIALKEPAAAPMADSANVELVIQDMERRLDVQYRQIEAADTKNTVFLTIFGVLAAGVAFAFRKLAASRVSWYALALTMVAVLGLVSVSIWVQSPERTFMKMLTYDLASSPAETRQVIARSEQSEYLRNRRTLVRKAGFAGAAYLLFGIYLSFAYSRLREETFKNAGNVQRAQASAPEPRANPERTQTPGR